LKRKEEPVVPVVPETEEPEPETKEEEEEEHEPHDPEDHEGKDSASAPEHPETDEPIAEDEPVPTDAHHRDEPPYYGPVEKEEKKGNNPSLTVGNVGGEADPDAIRQAEAQATEVYRIIFENF